MEKEEQKYERDKGIKHEITTTINILKITEVANFKTFRFIKYFNCNSLINKPIVVINNATIYKNSGSYPFIKAKYENNKFKRIEIETNRLYFRNLPVA